VKFGFDLYRVLFLTNRHYFITDCYYFWGENWSKREFHQNPSPQTLILPSKNEVNEFYGALQAANNKAYRTTQMTPTEGSFAKFFSLIDNWPILVIEKSDD